MIPIEVGIVLSIHGDFVVAFDGRQDVNVISVFSIPHESATRKLVIAISKTCNTSVRLGIWERLKYGDLPRVLITLPNNRPDTMSISSPGCWRRILSTSDNAFALRSTVCRTLSFEELQTTSRQSPAFAKDPSIEFKSMSKIKAVHPDFTTSAWSSQFLDLDRKRE